MAPTDVGSSQSMESLTVSTRTSIWSSTGSGISSHIYMNLLPQNEGLSDVTLGNSNDSSNVSSSVSCAFSNLDIPVLDYGEISEANSTETVAPFVHDHRGYIDAPADIVQQQRIVNSTDHPSHSKPPRAPRVINISKEPPPHGKFNPGSLVLMVQKCTGHTTDSLASFPEKIFAECSITSLPSNMTDSIHESRRSRSRHEYSHHIHQVSHITKLKVNGCTRKKHRLVSTKKTSKRLGKRQKSCIESNQSTTDLTYCGLANILLCAKSSRK